MNLDFGVLYVVDNTVLCYYLYLFGVDGDNWSVPALIILLS